jgi:hypothetical protein
VGQGGADVLAAYQAQWTDFEAAARVFPVDPNNPTLARHMAGNQLSQVRNQLSIMRSQGQYIQGPFVDLSRARVTGVQPGPGGSATVADCELDPSYLVSGPSGHAVSHPSGVRNLVHATLQLLGSQWKVTALRVLNTGCKNS